MWSWVPKGSPIPRRTGRLTVGRKINSTQLMKGRSFGSYRLYVVLIGGTRPTERGDDSR
jgi:hypothetical protein